MYELLYSDVCLSFTANTEILNSSDDFLVPFNDRYLVYQAHLALLS